MKYIKVIGKGMVEAAACAPGGKIWRQGVFHCAAGAAKFCDRIAEGKLAGGILDEPFCDCYPIGSIVHVAAQ